MGLPNGVVYLFDSNHTMKKIYFNFILLLALCLAAKAQQIPNGGFETWTNPKNPDGWYTFSSASNVIDLAHKDTVDKVEGTASAEIQSIFISGASTYEILSLGTADYTFGNTFFYTYYPVYFPYRPDTLFFSYKYSTTATDTASAFIKLKNGDSTLLQSLLPLWPAAQWTNSYILLTPLYVNANTPDSLLIQFKSSIADGGYVGTPGSILHVDAARFGYVSNTTGVAQLTNGFAANIYPNPATNTIYADCKNGYMIYTSTGILIKQSSLATSNITINDLAPGLYILKSGNSVARFVKAD